VEAALDLAGVVEHVTIVEVDERLRADQVLIDKATSMVNIDVVTGARVMRLVANGRGTLGGLVYRDTQGQEHTLPVEGVFVQIGLVPGTAWLEESAVERTARGEIVVDVHGRTNVPGVYGAGDCTDLPHKQIGTAMSGGIQAALGAFEDRMRMVQAGTAAIRAAETATIATSGGDDLIQ
jgi:alkyl hydroperoxide reductase subunit F